MSSEKSANIDHASLQARLDVSSFHRWLGLHLISASEREIVIKMPEREDIYSVPDPQTVHGGILASLIDLAGLYALLAAGVPARATADLRVDYHRPAAPGTLRVTGRVIKPGRRICCAEAQVHNTEGVLLASGRGTYIPV